MDQNTSQKPPPVAPNILPMPNDYHAYHPPQRVLVTGSMLYAYAVMRGNVDKDSHQPDPLHHALFLNPTRYVMKPQFEQQIDIPSWQLHNDPLMTQELAPGAVFFHDVSGLLYPNPHPPQKTLQADNLEQYSLTYENYKHQTPPTPPNHCKGNEAYGNYGYVEINGCWVDPDSKKELDDAFSSRAPNVPRLPIGVEPVPLLYEDQIYRDFMAEVQAESGDGEGDPRAMYITPATFARWAAGASKGDRYLNMKVPSQDPPLSELRGRTRTRKPPPTRQQPQFCQETGSDFSGEYSPERSPSLCMTSRGVDMMQQPGNFIRSYPQAAIDMNRAAFGGLSQNNESREKVTDWLEGSTATIIHFTEDEAIENLGDLEDTDPNTGLKQWNQYVDTVNSLNKEWRDDLYRSLEARSRNNEMGIEALQLYKEAYFMELRLNKRDLEMGTPTTRRSITRDFAKPTPAKPPQPEFRQADEPTPTRAPHRQNAHEAMADNSTPPSPQSLPTEPSSPASAETTPPRPLRRKNKFEQYFQERQEWERINVNKMRVTNTQIGVDLKDIEETLRELKVVHAEYLDSLGVKSVSEIPDLIPLRKKESLTNAREEMNKKIAGVQ